MKGRPCGLHPAAAMERKNPPCGRKDSKVEVMDHGVGFMMIGCSDLSQACRILDEYVDNIEDYRFFARLLGEDVKGRLFCCVWASTDVAAHWDGGLGGLKVRV